jgi:dGTPase
MNYKNSVDKKFHPVATKNYGEHVKRLYGDKKEEIENAQEKSRNSFQRDKNRILYSKSFRKLIHKTQVCYAGTIVNEDIRTRLTHTLEVSQIARSISYQLNLNEDLAEAIALGHDLGHTPFGHRGEASLQEIFSGKDNGIMDEFFKSNTPNVDFKHNFQSIRVLTELEEGYPDFKGLNLTVPVLEGILKHTKIKSSDGVLFDYENITKDDIYHLDQTFSCSIEGQIVALADEIAQVSHDIEDAIEHGYDTKKIILEELKLIIKDIPIEGLDKIQSVDDTNIKYVISCIIGTIIITAINNIKTSIANKNYSYPLDTEIATDIVLNDLELFKRLQKIENTYIIHNYTVDRMNDKSKFIIRQIIRAYLNNPKQLPNSVLEKYTNICKIKPFTKALKEFDEQNRNIRYIEPGIFEKHKGEMIQDPEYLRLICDHISSMTDTTAVEEFRQLYSDYVG